jgi:hypothetical protein
MAGKLVVKVKKPEALDPVEARPRKLNSKEKKARAWHEALHSKGLRQYRFVWPLGTVERLLGCHEKKANDYVLELIEREIASRTKP